MKLRKALFTLSVVALLTSCNKVQIRSDIAEFIASFSLEESVRAYLEGGYTQTIISTTDEEVSKEITTFDFNVKDNQKPQYLKTVSTYKNDVLETEKSEEIIIKDDKYYFKNDEGEKEYTLQECHDLIEKFFYEQSSFDDTYHSRGMYRGDYILQGIEYFQPYASINEEKSLMTFDISEDSYDGNGQKTHINSVYSVNTLGMLVEQNIVGSKTGLTKTLNLKVYKK